MLLSLGLRAIGGGGSYALVDLVTSQSRPALQDQGNRLFAVASFQRHIFGLLFLVFVDRGVRRDSVRDAAAILFFLGFSHI